MLTFRNEVIVYLYFINHYKSFPIVQNALFHYYRFMKLKGKNDIAEKHFYFDANHQVYDSQQEEILRLLMHHNLITSKKEATTKGKNAIEKALNKTPSLHQQLNQFLRQYNNETSHEKSCFIDHPYFSICCARCKDHTCEQIKFTLNDIKAIVGFKGLKTPYKSL